MHFTLHINLDKSYPYNTGTKAPATVKLAGYPLWSDDVWVYPDDAETESMAWQWFTSRLRELIERGETWSEED